MQEIPKKIYDKLRYRLLYLCMDRDITPNMVTITNHVMTILFATYFFSRGTYISNYLGVFVMGINVILDYLDGDLARSTCRTSELGSWLDSSFDVIIQSIVMGAIAVGCFKNGLGVLWIVLFFISVSANNLVSFNYNNTFGFNSYSGNHKFREYMDQKKTIVNVILKSIIDPTDNIVALSIITFRYWIILGCVTNTMKECFIAMTVISSIKWMVMYVIYALHQVGYKKLFVLKPLVLMAAERKP